MSNSTQLLKVFHTGFLICLVLAGIFLVLSILLFVKFNIKGIWEMKSGRARARAIKEKEEESAKSGKIRAVKKTAPELMKSGSLKEIPPPKSQESPVVIGASAQIREGTNLTTALSPKDRQAGKGKFIIEKQIIYVHTEDVI